MIKCLLLSIIVSSVLIGCKKQETKIVNKEIAMSWIYEYLEPEEVLKDSSADLIDRAAYHYQNNLLKSVPPKSQLKSDDVHKLINYTKNTKKMIKVHHISDSISIIEGLDFDSGGDLKAIKNIWEFKNESWVNYFDPEREYPFNAYDFYHFDFDGDTSKEILLKKDCCDSSQLIIYKYNTQDGLSTLYSNTLYGEEYEIRKEIENYFIYVKGKNGQEDLLQINNSFKK